MEVSELVSAGGISRCIAATTIPEMTEYYGKKQTTSRDLFLSGGSRLDALLLKAR